MKNFVKSKKRTHSNNSDVSDLTVNREVIFEVMHDILNWSLPVCVYVVRVTNGK